MERARRKKIRSLKSNEGLAVNLVVRGKFELSRRLRPVNPNFLVELKIFN